MTRTAKKIVQGCARRNQRRAQVASKASQAVKKILQWSFSRWRDYEQCPRKAKYKHIDKLREPENAATENGTIVHKLGQQYVEGALRAVPKEFSMVKETMVKLRAEKAVAEKEWAFTKDWTPTGWFAKDTWVRIKVDAASTFLEIREKARVNIGRCVDYKTGKEHDEHVYQRSLYAIAMFIMFPDIVECVVVHVYTDHGFNREQKFKRTDLQRLKLQWEQRSRAMLADTRFAPRPGNYCRWCFFSKSKGGSCEF